MEDILLQFSDPVGWLVLAGAALQAGACIFTNQIILRSVLLAGSVHYLAYYTAVAHTPLWPAIAGTSVMAMANMIGIARVINKRRRERRAAASACLHPQPAWDDHPARAVDIRFAHRDRKAAPTGFIDRPDAPAPANHDGPGAVRRLHADELRV